MPSKLTLAAAGAAAGAALAAAITWSIVSSGGHGARHGGGAGAAATGTATPAASTGSLVPAASASAGGGKGAAALPGAADLATIPGHNLLPPCLPPGFVLPSGTQVQGVNSTGGAGPCTATGGSFQVLYAQPRSDVIAFLRQAFQQPGWSKSQDHADTVKLYDDNGVVTGSIGAWKLVFVNDPNHSAASSGSYSASFIIWTYHGQTDGNIVYAPPKDKQTS